MKVKKMINGVEIPVLGFGTSRLAEKSKECVIHALTNGYRLIDTAQTYNNEQFIGNSLNFVIHEHGLKREELFLTSKLNQATGGYADTLSAFQKSLDLLQTDYLDLFLIHAPVAWGYEDCYTERNQETWRAFETLYQQNKVRSLGVSNFLERHLIDIFEVATVAPMINQLELHPGYQQRGLVKFCRKHDLLLEAWSPLGRGILEKEPYFEMAKRYQKDIGQIALRWSLQKGFIPLTRTSNVDRILSNKEIFDWELSEDDVNLIDALNSHDGFRDMWSYKRQQMY